MPSLEKPPSTLYDKIYADHVVDGHTIYIDRFAVHLVFVTTFRIGFGLFAERLFVVQTSCARSHLAPGFRRPTQCQQDCPQTRLHSGHCRSRDPSPAPPNSLVPPSHLPNFCNRTSPPTAEPPTRTQRHLSRRPIRVHNVWPWRTMSRPSS